MADGEGDEGAAGADVDLGRVLALSDGVFAIALTLLVLDLVLPDRLHSAGEVNDQLRELLPNVFAFLLSFAVIGRYWISHRQICRGVRRVDVGFLWLNLGCLLPIALMPASTRIIAEYGEYPVPTALYAATIAAAGLTGVLLARYAARRLDGPRDDDFAYGGLAVAGVFAVSIPVAFWSPDLAKVTWLLIPPASAFAARLASTRATDASGRDR